MIRSTPPPSFLARARLAVALACLIGVGHGCGDSGPEMAPVSGKVTYNGAPLAKGTVSFVSTDPEHPDATSPIGPDGSYTLTTRETGDGAQLGDYTVIVTDIGADEVLDYIPKKPVENKSKIPTKFGDPAQSGLKVTVKSGSNSIPVELKD